jgi:hypothetical protein
MTSKQTALLEAVATVRLIIQGDGHAADRMVSESEDSIALGRTACAVAAGLLIELKPDEADTYLAELTQAAMDQQN